LKLELLVCLNSDVRPMTKMLFSPPCIQISDCRVRYGLSANCQTNVWKRRGRAQIAKMLFLG